MISCATFVTKFVFPALTFEVSHNAGGAERERGEKGKGENNNK